MDATHILKQKLLTELEKLPGDRLAEVLDFVGYLLAKGKKIPSEIGTVLDPEKDPILNFIGGVSHGSLAKDIDKELYGG